MCITGFQMMQIKSAKDLPLQFGEMTIIEVPAFNNLDEQAKRGFEVYVSTGYYRGEPAYIYTNVSKAFREDIGLRALARHMKAQLLVYCQENYMGDKR